MKIKPTPGQSAYTVYERAGNLPPPNKEFPIIVPLDLLPSYYEVHGIHPVTYVFSKVHGTDIMICSKKSPSDSRSADILQNSA